MRDNNYTIFIWSFVLPKEHKGPYYFVLIQNFTIPKEHRGLQSPYVLNLDTVREAAKEPAEEEENNDEDNETCKELKIPRALALVTIIITR